MTQFITDDSELELFTELIVQLKAFAPEAHSDWLLCCSAADAAFSFNLTYVDETGSSLHSTPVDRDAWPLSEAIEETWHVFQKAFADLPAPEGWVIFYSPSLDRPEIEVFFPDDIDPKYGFSNEEMRLAHKKYFKDMPLVRTKLW